ncbi:MAG: MotA/TolQ/ExbB proton channel family protein [Deltaproteobacteria bacterium]|nr:MotA/TolQ/ExbB proton channel family protein [Deltaproteobacteria bacterium]
MELQETGFLEILKTSGPIGISVFIILLIMSVLSWAIIFMKYVQLNRATFETDKFLEFFFKSSNLKQIVEVAKQYSNSPVAQMFESGFKDVVMLRDDFKDIDNTLAVIDRHLKRVFTQQISALESWVSFLATTASTAPFIGLFGTVIGIMNAFHGLTFVKESTIQAVAPGIAEALLATAVGLGAAIPAALAFNYFTVKLKKLKATMVDFIDDFKVMVRVSG